MGSLNFSPHKIFCFLLFFPFFSFSFFFPFSLTFVPAGFLPGSDWMVAGLFFRNFGDKFYSLAYILNCLVMSCLYIKEDLNSFPRRNTFLLFGLLSLLFYSFRGNTHNQSVPVVTTDFFFFVVFGRFSR